MSKKTVISTIFSKILILHFEDQTFCQTFSPKASATEAEAEGKRASAFGRSFGLRSPPEYSAMGSILTLWDQGHTVHYHRAFVLLSKPKLYQFYEWISSYGSGQNQSIRLSTNFWAPIATRGALSNNFHLLDRSPFIKKSISKIHEFQSF